MCISKPSSVVDCGQYTAPGSKVVGGDTLKKHNQIMLRHIDQTVVLTHAGTFQHEVCLVCMKYLFIRDHKINLILLLINYIFH